MVSWMGRGEGNSFFIYSNCACMCLIIKGCGFGGEGVVSKKDTLMPCTFTFVITCIGFFYFNILMHFKWITKIKLMFPCLLKHNLLQVGKVPHILQITMFAFGYFMLSFITKLYFLSFDRINIKPNIAEMFSFVNCTVKFAMIW